jgi:hypothetical protein
MHINMKQKTVYIPFADHILTRTLIYEQGVVAVALTSRMNFAERVAAFGRPTAHAVVVWNFRDLIHPYVVLEAPHEVTAFDFNPEHLEAIVGGCANGQVVLWEVTDDTLDQASLVRSCALETIGLKYSDALAFPVCSISWSLVLRWCMRGLALAPPVRLAASGLHVLSRL